MAWEWLLNERGRDARATAGLETGAPLTLLCAPLTLLGARLTLLCARLALLCAALRLLVATLTLPGATLRLLGAALRLLRATLRRLVATPWVFGAAFRLSGDPLRLSIASGYQLHKQAVAGLAAEDGFVAEDAVEGGTADAELAGGAELVAVVEVEHILDMMADHGVEG